MDTVVKFVCRRCCQHIEADISCIGLTIACPACGEDTPAPRGYKPHANQTAKPPPHVKKRMSEMVENPCWYCGKRPNSAYVEIEMWSNFRTRHVEVERPSFEELRDDPMARHRLRQYEEVLRGGSMQETRWDSQKVLIQQCERCEKMTIFLGWLIGVSTVIGGVIGAILLDPLETVDEKGMPIFQPPSTIPLWVVYIFVRLFIGGCVGGCVLLVGAGIGWLLQCVVRGTFEGRSAENHPAVKDMLERGWKIGPAP